MTEASWARPQDKNEIVDFCDLVFSKAHRPHDFTTLLPRLYGEGSDGAAHHFLLREDGRIVATILSYPIPVHVGGQTLLSLGVGSVSTHPRFRGQGFMKTLLAAVDDRARELGADFAVLGGQRQRYEHFRYVHAGYQLRGTLSPDNVRHALRTVSCEGYAIAPMTQADVPAALALHTAQPSFCERREDAFLDVLRSWNASPFVLTKDGAFIGYASVAPGGDVCRVQELRLADEGDAPAALKLLSTSYGALSLIAAPWEAGRAARIAALCDDYAIVHNSCVKFYRPARVAAAYAALGCGGDSLTQTGFSLPLPLFIAPADRV